MAEEIYHIPVLLQPSVDGLDIKPDGVFVDVTFGGGGHTREILSRMTKGRLFGFDQDQDAFDNCPKDSRFVFVQSNFRYLKNFLRYHDVEAVDGILADLGVSSHHFDEAERGFSFRFEEVEFGYANESGIGFNCCHLVEYLAGRSGWLLFFAIMENSGMPGDLQGRLRQHAT